MTRKQKKQWIRKIERDLTLIDLYGNLQYKMTWDGEMYFYSDVYDRYVGITVHIKREDFELPITTE